MPKCKSLPNGYMQRRKSLRTRKTDDKRQKPTEVLIPEACPRAPSASCVAPFPLMVCGFPEWHDEIHTHGTNTATLRANGRVQHGAPVRASDASDTLPPQASLHISSFDVLILLPPRRNGMRCLWCVFSPLNFYAEQTTSSFFVQSAKTLLLAAVRAVFGEPRKVET